MDPTLAAIGGIALLALLVLIGMPVSFAMLLSGVVGIALFATPEAAYKLLATNVWDNFASYTLSVIPLFSLMGQFAFRSGITRALYNAAYKWVGHLPGGIGVTTLVASSGFSSISGSNSATCAAIGTVALPEMKRYGYAPVLSTASVAVGGSLGVVIPPSVVLLIIALSTEQSITELFTAALVPGLLLMSLLVLTVIVMCWARPELGPPGPRFPFLERVKALGGVVETLVLFLLIIGGLYAGWFSPTQAGAAGAFGALIIALLRRGLNWQGFVQSLLETLKTSAMVILLLAGSVVFGRFLALTRLPFTLAEWVASLHMPPLLVLIIVLLIYLVGGGVMDDMAFLVVTLPIFFPMLVALGFHPVWLSVVLTIITTLGAVVPPIAINVFVVSGLAEDVPITTVFKGVVPFLPAYFVCLGLLYLFPRLVLWLPKSM